jgi:hypothetical protein
LTYFGYGAYKAPRTRAAALLASAALVYFLKIAFDGMELGLRRKASVGLFWSLVFVRTGASLFL